MPARRIRPAIPFALPLVLAVGVMLMGCVAGSGSAPVQAPSAAVPDAAPVTTAPLSQDQIAAVPLAGPGAAPPAMVTTSQGDVAQGTAAIPAPSTAPTAPTGATPQAAPGVGAVIPDPGAAPTTTAPAADPAATACAAIGGSWVRAGSESGGYACVRPMLDAGKICRKKGDCAGQCLARSATCAPIEPLFGCNDIIDANGQWVTQCIN